MPSLVAIAISKFWALKTGTPSTFFFPSLWGKVFRSLLASLTWKQHIVGSLLLWQKIPELMCSEDFKQVSKSSWMCLTCLSFGTNWNKSGFSCIAHETYKQLFQKGQFYKLYYFFFKKNVLRSKMDKFMTNWQYVSIVCSFEIGAGSNVTSIFHSSITFRKYRHHSKLCIWN